MILQLETVKLTDRSFIYDINCTSQVWITICVLLRMSFDHLRDGLHYKKRDKSRTLENNFRCSLLHVQMQDKFGTWPSKSWGPLLCFSRVGHKVLSLSSNNSHVSIWALKQGLLAVIIPVVQTGPDKILFQTYFSVSDEEPNPSLWV